MIAAASSHAARQRNDAGRAHRLKHRQHARIIERAVLWMASNDSGMMTGAVIPFDQSVYGRYDDAPTPAKKLEA
jgi:hypothetical protein